MATTIELLLKTVRAYNLSRDAIAEGVREAATFKCSVQDSFWLVDALLLEKGAPMIVAEAIINLVIEHKDIWKDRYEAAEQALEGTIAACNKLRSLGDG